MENGEDEKIVISDGKISILHSLAVLNYNFR